MKATAQRLVLAAAAGRARGLRLKLNTAGSRRIPTNGVGWLLGTPDTMPENKNHCQLDKIIARTLASCNNPKA
ncbi:MAG TPA: hypothetical protein PLN86_12415 [Candidatus Hydrogenedentes bacterium]|nr:hypothetical protein [Candidatus Hydrogenedentota bacterium]